MRRYTAWSFVLAGAILLALASMSRVESWQPKRTEARRPDLSGIWQALNTAN